MAETYAMIDKDIEEGHWLGLRPAIFPAITSIRMQPMLLPHNSICFIISSTRRFVGVLRRLLVRTRHLCWEIWEDMLNFPVLWNIRWHTLVATNRLIWCYSKRCHGGGVTINRLIATVIAVRFVRNRLSGRRGLMAFESIWNSLGIWWPVYFCSQMDQFKEIANAITGYYGRQLCCFYHW